MPIDLLHKLLYANSVVDEIPIPQMFTV